MREDIESSCGDCYDPEDGTVVDWGQETCGILDHEAASSYVFGCLSFFDVSGNVVFSYHDLP